MELIYNITKEVVSYPISLDQVKQQIQLPPDDNSEDDYLQLLIEGAIGVAEDYTNGDIAEKTVTYKALGFDKDKLEIMVPNIAAVISIKEKTESSYSDVTSFKTEFNRKSTTIYFSETVNTSELVITLTTGFTAATIPKGVRAAILIKCSDLYDNERAGYTYNVKPNKAFENFLNPHRINYW